MKYDQLPLHYFGKDIRRLFDDKPTKGLIFGNFGACNVGDEAILAGELAELQTIPTTVTAVSRFPKNVKKLHKVTTVPFSRPLEIIKQISHSDYVIVGGGGLFCKNDAGLKGLLFQLYTILFFLALPKLLRKKLLVIGIGFYENTNPVIAFLARQALSFADGLGARDQATYSYLKKHGLSVKLYKDSSFHMPLEINRFAPKKHNKRYTVGLALNKPQAAKDAKYLRKVIAAFLNRYKENTHFLFYSLDYHPLYESDRVYMQSILTKAGKKPTISYEFMPVNQHPQQVFSSFKLADFMIVSRLHGSIFSHRLNVPFYGIAYDTKCASFLKSISHQFRYPAKVTEKEIATYYEAAIIDKELPKQKRKKFNQEMLTA